MNVQPDVQSADVSRKQSASAGCEDVNHGAAATPMGSRERMSAPFERGKDERVRERGEEDSGVGAEWKSTATASALCNNHAT